MSGPERIWVASCHPCTEPDDYYVQHPDYTGFASIGYIRADIHDEAVKALRLLIARAEGLVFAHHHGNGLEGWHNSVNGVERALEAARAALAKIGEAG